MLALRASKDWRRNFSAFRHAFAISIITSSCSACGITSGTASDKTWLQNGSLGLSRPVPPVSSSSAQGSETSSPRASLRPDLAEPLESASGNTLVISRRDKTLTALPAGASPLVIKTEGAQFLPEGSFSVTVKEQDPLWYAPRDYFLKRSLPVPDEGSRERFKRAALGSKTIFLNNSTPIHSGPVWMQEIGGVRLSESEMEQIFSMVTIGTRVEIR